MDGDLVIRRDITPVILAGGMGSRLRPVTGSLPKALAPVRGRPFIDFLLAQLAEAGCARVILATGHGADEMMQTLGDRRLGLELVHSTEPAPLGTGGALRLAAAKGWSDTFLVMNGDTCIRVKLLRFVSWHMKSGHPASLVVGKMADTGRFGRVETGEGQLVTGFQEKSAPGLPGLVNTGLLLVEKKIITAIPAGLFVSLETDVLPLLVKEKSLHYFPEPADFHDIGTLESYRAAENWLSFPHNAATDKDRPPP